MSAGDEHGNALTHGEQGHGTRRSYLIGFALSVLLTAVPFWLVMAHVLTDPRITVLAIMACAAVQVIVHTIFFLHVTTQAEGGWTLMALAFAGVVITLVVGGSLWIMYHLNSNMMPMAPGSMPGM